MLLQEHKAEPPRRYITQTGQPGARGFKTRIKEGAWCQLQRYGCFGCHIIWLDQVHWAELRDRRSKRVRCLGTTFLKPLGNKRHSCRSSEQLYAVQRLSFHSDRFSNRWLFINQITMVSQHHGVFGIVLPKDRGPPSLLLLPCTSFDPHMKKDKQQIRTLSNHRRITWKVSEAAFSHCWEGRCFLQWLQKAVRGNAPPRPPSQSSRPTSLRP